MGDKIFRQSPCFFFNGFILPSKLELERFLFYIKIALKKGECNRESLDCNLNIHPYVFPLKMIKHV